MRQSAGLCRECPAPWPKRIAFAPDFWPSRPRQNALIFAAAAFFEITGCFAVWGWWRLDKSALWLIPAAVCLGLFAWLLTLVDVEHAGRAYAIYGGIYIIASLVWLWAVEGTRPDRWDTIGSAICLIGAAVILFGPRQA